MAIAACNNNTEVTFSNVYNGGVPVAGKAPSTSRRFKRGRSDVQSGERAIAPSSTSNHLPRNISKQPSWTLLGTLTAPDRQPTTHITLQQGVSTKVLACDLYITFDLSSQATAFVVNRGSYSAKSAFMLRRTGPLSCEIYYRVEKDFGFGSYQVQTTRGSYWRPDGASLSAPSDALEIRSDEMLSTTRLTAVQPLANPTTASTAEVAGLLNRLIEALKT